MDQVDQVRSISFLLDPDNHPVCLWRSSSPTHLHVSWGTRLIFGPTGRPQKKLLQNVAGAQKSQPELSAVGPIIPMDMT